MNNKGTVEQAHKLIAGGAGKLCGMIVHERMTRRQLLEVIESVTQGCQMLQNLVSKNTRDGA